MGLQSSLSGKNALKTAGIYFFVSMVWILLSDLAVEIVAQSRHQLTILQTYKGWFFVAFTTVLLYFLTKAFIRESLRRYEQKQQLENKLDTYTNLLDTIINSTPDAIYVKDKNGRYLLFNEAAASVVGKNKDEVIGLDDYALFDPDTARKMRADDAAVLHEHNITNKEETFSVGDREYSFWITKGIVRDSSADILGTFGISRDITRQKENEHNLSRQKQEYYDLAHYDQLTGLPNRLDMTEKLDAAAREGRVRTLILLDLDLFKIINESYGHRFGDKVLQKVAELLCDIFDQQAEVFRMGGDEFAVVAQYNDRKRIQKEVEEFLDRLAKPILVGETDIYVTASVGIEDFGPISSDTQKLLQNVDAALSKAKEMGKNTYTFYQVGFTKDAIRHSDTAVNLKIALEKKQLLLHYQPQVDPVNNRIVGFEGLVRWHRGDRLINPSEFIPVAEQSSMIIDIDLYVLHEGFVTAQKLAKETKHFQKLALNVSARHVAHPQFLNHLETLLAQTGCDAGLIELEITESAVLTHPEYIRRVLTKLRQLGFSIALDDFGTGYSSLAYLKDLPIDKLKIDMSFIRDIHKQPKNQTIVSAMVTVGKGLGLQILAEGVEKGAELEFVNAMGIDAVQGFLYEKGVPLYAARKMLETGSVPKSS